MQKFLEQVVPSPNLNGKEDLNNLYLLEDKDDDVKGQITTKKAEIDKEEAKEDNREDDEAMEEEDEIKQKAEDQAYIEDLENLPPLPEEEYSDPGDEDYFPDY